MTLPDQQTDAQPSQPTVVHVARPIEPEVLELTPEQQRRHDESVDYYPRLNLSRGEYVIREMRRHPIGLFAPIAVGIVLLTAAFSILANYDIIAESVTLIDLTGTADTVFWPIVAFAITVGLGMFIAYYVYVSNTFFLTNESVIQEIRHSLFSHHEQTVSLGNIEDASYTQRGILQTIFNYGDIRLSTEGDETTYRFSYVSNPKEHIATLNNAVESFKNGRPVTGD